MRPILLLAAVFFVQSCAQQSAPDTVFVNGKILTVDADFSIVQALAVTGNEITALGTNDKINALVSADTRVIDLDGKTLIPGLIDNHNHLIYNAPTWPNGVRLGSVRTRAAALQRISAKAEEIGPGEDAAHDLLDAFGLEAVGRHGDRLLGPRGEGVDHLEQVGRQRRLAAAEQQVVERRHGRGDAGVFFERQLVDVLVELAPIEAAGATAVAAIGDEDGQFPGL